MGKLLTYLGESKILKRIADVLNVKDVKVNGTSVVDENGIANITGSIHGIFEFVEELPETGESNIIYLVPSETTGVQNIYDEYIWTEDDTWELIGSTEMDLSNYYTKTETDTLLGDKVDKVSGKGLSTNDYTTNEKNKLSGIETGAEVNVQSDWNESDNTKDDYIKNKPTIPAAQVNSDWNASSGVAQILNKPTIPDAQIQSDWTQSDNTKKDFIKNKPTLATVATSGSYNDLSNKPTIPTVNNKTITIQKNGTAITDGSFTLNQSTDKSINITMSASDVGLGNVPNVTTNNQTPTFTQASTRANIASGEKLSVIFGKIMKFFADLKTVAFTGSYNDLTNKPSIPSAQVNSDWTASSGVAEILNKPTLATVATSGSYNDLSNKPSISNNKITLTNQTFSVGDFTINQSSDKSIDIKAIRTNRGASMSTNTRGFWAAMCNSGQAGSPVCPTSSQWWHILSMDWNDTDNTSWWSQLALPTSQNDGVFYRKSSATSGTTIDSEPWKRLADANSNGYANRALADGDGNTISSTYFKTANIKNTYSGTDGNAISGKGVKAALDTLATVATSGSYNDLSNKPTINNKTIKVQVNSADFTNNTFTLNQSSDKTIDIPVTKSDVGLGNVPNVTTNNQKPTFTQASSRANLVSGTDTLSTILGKLMKWYADLKAVAFSGNASDLTQDASNRLVTDTEKATWNAKGSSNLTLGETSSTAYRGDRGKTAYTHATDSSRLTTATATGLYKVGCTAEGHISELTAIAKADITGLGIPGSDTNTIPSAYCNTAAGTAAKTASCTDYQLANNTWIHVLIKTSNTAQSALTLNINGKGAKAIYINGTASSDTNYTLPQKTYLVYYTSNVYYFRTDGYLPQPGAVVQSTDRPIVYVDDYSIDMKAAHVGLSGEKYQRAVQFRDKNGLNFCNFNHRFTYASNDNDTLSETRIGARIYKTDGTTNYQNVIALRISRTGVSSYNVTNPSAFRTAIGVNNGKWTLHSTISATDTANKKLMASSYDEVMFVPTINLDYEGSTVPITVPITIPILSLSGTSSSSAKRIRQGWFQNGSNGGVVELLVWIASDYVYVTKGNIYANNASYKTATPIEVYYR